MELDPLKIQETKERIEKRWEHVSSEYKDYIASEDGMRELEEKVERLVRGLTEEDKKMHLRSPEEFKRRKEETRQKYFEMREKMVKNNVGS